MRTAPAVLIFLPHPHAKPRHCEAGAHTGLAIRTILCRGGHPSACQKSLAEFAARRRQRNKIIFSRDMRVRENTSQAASVEFVRLRRTNYARSRLQAFCRKNPEGFSTVSNEDCPRSPHFFQSSSLLFRGDLPHRPDSLLYLLLRVVAGEAKAHRPLLGGTQSPVHPGRTVGPRPGGNAVVLR